MDLSLNESQQLLKISFSELLAKGCPTSHVRECEASGFSSRLWEQYCEFGASVMGIPESAGGLEMGLLELGLVAMESGRALAPVPFVESAVVGRLLARLAPDDPLLGAIANGAPAGSIAIPRPNAVRGTSVLGEGRVLVPFGAVATSLVAADEESVFVVERSAASPAPRLRDLGSGALAACDARRGAASRVIGTGSAATAAFARAVSEWKLLTGFWLAGLGRRALEIGTEYAKERVQFGVPIGGFQAIAHPLAECAIRSDGAELLCWEAAWSDAEDPSRFDMLASMAFAWSVQTAIRCADVSLHTHGGYGFSTEYDIQLYFRRARALASIGGGAKEELPTIARRRFAHEKGL